MIYHADYQANLLPFYTNFRSLKDITPIIVYHITNYTVACTKLAHTRKKTKNYSN